MKTSPYLFLSFILFFYCQPKNSNFEEPKPRGYFRLQLPNKHYFPVDTIYPFTFEIPIYAKISELKPIVQDEYWFNLEMPQIKASIHFSYKKIINNLYTYTEDTRNFVYKHVSKAENIRVTDYSDMNNRIFGLIYFIDGVDAASPIQFYVTDSIRHFLRGALYFNHQPNNDSIQPIIDFIKHDIMHFIKTLRWKE